MEITLKYINIYTSRLGLSQKVALSSPLKLARLISTALNSKPLIYANSFFVIATGPDGERTTVKEAGRWKVYQRDVKPLFDKYDTNKLEKMMENANEIEKGTILASHTGTKKTTPHFYQCLEITKKTLILQELASELVTYSAAHGSGRKQPTENAIGPKFRRKIRQGASDGTSETYVEISKDELAYKWDGIAQYFSDLEK